MGLKTQEKRPRLNSMALKYTDFISHSGCLFEIPYEQFNAIFGTLIGFFLSFNYINYGLTDNV
jgi:hypothetical protein